MGNVGTGIFKCVAFASPSLGAHSNLQYESDVQQSLFTGTVCVDGNNMTSSCFA